MTKRTWGRKVLFNLPTLRTSLRESGAGTQGRNLEPGTEAKAKEECCLLVGPSQFVWLDFSYHLEPQAQTLLHQPLIKKCHTGQSSEDVFSTEVPSSQTAVAFLKLTNNTNQGNTYKVNDCKTPTFSSS